MFKNIEIRSGGSSFNFWQSLEITYSLDTIAASLVAIVSQLSTQDKLIEFGDDITVYYQGHVIFNGYLDKQDRILKKDELKITITARTLTADLVDCTASANYQSLDLASIVKKLSEPYKIKIIAKAKTKLVEKFVCQSENIFTSIATLIQAQNLFIYPDNFGQLIIDKADFSITAGVLEEGKNILSINHLIDKSVRFSKYVVKSDEQQEATVLDTGVARYRLLETIADSSSSLESLKDKVDKERLSRIAKGSMLKIEIADFLIENKLIYLNQAVKIISRSFGIAGVYLIIGLKFVLDDSLKLELTLASKEVFK